MNKETISLIPLLQVQVLNHKITYVTDGDFFFFQKLIFLMSKALDRQHWVTSADNYYIVRLHGNWIQQENNYSTSEICYDL